MSNLQQCRSCVHFKVFFYSWGTRPDCEIMVKNEKWEAYKEGECPNYISNQWAKPEEAGYEIHDCVCGTVGSMAPHLYFMRWLTPEFKQKYNSEFCDVPYIELSGESYPMIPLIFCPKCGEHVKVTKKGECE